MLIEIFDVELGQCAAIHCPNGQKVLIDAGHNASRPWWPSLHFQGQNIERLIISNFDEDHMSDFVDLKEWASIRTIYWNASINSSALSNMKTPSGMGKGINAIFHWIKGVEAYGTYVQPADLGGVIVHHYCNPYGAFTDTNNLSLVSFVSYGSFKIIFPGDLETAGWKELLKIPAFRSELASLNVFVASHHGRENGCCEEVFNYCNPLAVIISDSYKQHGTQETSNWYANRVTGCKTIGQTERRVLTTRNDGHITLEVRPGGEWFIATEAERAFRQQRA